MGEGFPLECPGCGGDIRLIAFITEPEPIRKILTHLGEPLEPPPISPARGPPTDWGEPVQVREDRAIFQASPDELPKLARGTTQRKKKPAGAMDGPGGRKVAGTGFEQTAFHSGNRRVVSNCDAKCDAISTDRIELLARAVVLVAGMRIPEAAREAVLARVTAELASAAEQ